MAIWTDDEARNLDPEYYHRETDAEARAWDDALERAVNDRLTSMEFVIQGYTKDGGTVGGEVEFNNTELMFTTQNILRNDPNLREIVEREILAHEQDLVEKYVRGEY